MNLVFCFLIVVISTAMGRLFSQRIAGRLVFFREYQLTFTQLADRVVGINLELYQALGFCRDGALKELFTGCAEGLKKTPQAAFGSIWQANLARLKSAFSYLTKDDMQIVAEGGSAVEALCLSPSEKQAELYLKRLSGYTAALENEKTKKCKLYNTTGVLAGLMIALLVI